jgi:hypothetical protein
VLHEDVDLARVWNWQSRGATAHDRERRQRSAPVPSHDPPQDPPPDPGAPTDDAGGPGSGGGAPPVPDPRTPTNGHPVVPGTLAGPPVVGDLISAPVHPAAQPDGLATLAALITVAREAFRRGLGQPQHGAHALPPRPRPSTNGVPRDQSTGTGSSSP